MLKFGFYGIIAASLSMIGLPALAQTADGETPAEETFCDDNFDGRLGGLCNAFCEAMDCDSLEAQASANACLKMEERIAPLLALNNTEFGPPDLVITMADPIGGTDGLCGEVPTAAVCPCWEDAEALNESLGPLGGIFDQCGNDIGTPFAFVSTQTGTGGVSPEGGGSCTSPLTGRVDFDLGSTAAGICKTEILAVCDARGIPITTQ